MSESSEQPVPAGITIGESFQRKQKTLAQYRRPIIRVAMQHVLLSTFCVAGGKRIDYPFLFLFQAKHRVQARIHEAAHA